ncbi:MAG TPA: RdgB/HAM1 family non-canonical purine NTP pyrophosphatase [Lacipirellulaceae bacterium]|jgi:XTP/dITP diphosphohydrolase|nr:RdgB/HAM1 family non-canonical purine NTP pyrophosphatase [Lacipirellulaceae bacterium]
MSESSYSSLVIGTHNRNKGLELAEMLAPHGFRVVTLADVADAIDVVEDGDSFAANAALKATQQARHLGRWVLADDSGLEVDALGGAPGIFSARFAGPNGTDDANNAELLKRLDNTPLERRSARYVCHVTVADPSAAIRAESHDVCHGRIRFEPAGTNGFGYDPLFEVVEYHRTFGELGPHVKQAISHRSRALRAILPKLVELLRTGC